MSLCLSKWMSVLMWIEYNWLILSSTSSWILLYVIQISSSESSLSQTLLHCLQFVVKIVSLSYTEKRECSWLLTEAWLSETHYEYLTVCLNRRNVKLIFLTMMYLTFFASNFLHRWSVCMFLRFNQILFSFLKS